ncbi:hypothetical protein GCM10020255_017570 [Rhodococcus baikonurensis]
MPAGSVALAAGYSAVYPRASPGGWQIIGSTDTVMWDLNATPPATVPRALRERGTTMNGLEILETGPLSLIQDLGRIGHLRSGVGVSGAADRRSLGLGNRLVGNDESAESSSVG